MAKPKSNPAGDQPAEQAPIETDQIETVAGEITLTGDPTPAPAQGNEGQAVAAEGADPSAGHDRSKEERLIVTGPARGRRRAGHHFTADQTTLFVADLSEDQVVGITNDPELVVVHLPAAV